METRRIRLEEYLDTKKLAALAFEWSFDAAKEDPLKFGEKTEKSKDKADRNWNQFWASFADNGEMMACMGVLPYEMYFDGHHVPMGGVGCVCAKPQYRRSGAVRSCFSGALAEMYKSGQVFSYLYPFNEQFYGKFGYERCCDSVQWHFDLSRLPRCEVQGTFTLYEGGELKQFEEVYQAVASRYNGMVARDQMDWDRIRNHDPYRDAWYSYLYKDENGVPKGYLSFQKVREPAGAVMDCPEFYFVDPAALQSMMGFVSRFAADYQILRIYTPVGEDLSWYFGNAVRSLSSRVVVLNGMARLVHVQRAFELARYRGSGSASIGVQDEMLPQNSGVWHLEFENGRCLRVEKTDGPADVTIPVGALGAALMGRLPAESFCYRPDITVVHGEALNQIFYWKPNWINNSF
jgi:predicted acetyltransferase